MGGGSAAYRVSKTALNALTRVLAADEAGTGILVNSLCPGWVRTRWAVESATRSVEEGADTAVWLATLPDDGPAAASSATASRSPGRRPWPPPPI